MRILSFLVSIPFQLFGVLMCVAFICIGVCVSLGGYMSIRDVGVMENTAYSSISSLQPGQMVKFTAMPSTEKLHYAPVSEIPAVFYRADYLRYYYDDEDGVTSSLQKRVEKPDSIALKGDDGQQYIINFKDNKPTMVFKTVFKYLKNPQTGQYAITGKSSFDDGDRVLEENLIVPKEEVFIFGQLEDIKEISPDKTLLVFKETSLGAPWEDFNAWIKNFYAALFENKVSLYALSTQGEKGVMDQGNFFAYFMIGFGLFFAFIPLIILGAIVKEVLTSLLRLAYP